MQDKFIITYMGAHGVANELDSLLDVAKECKDYKDITFMLIGDGMQKKALVQRATEEGLDNVLFIDSQPKKMIPDFCNASDVCTAVLKKVETFKTVYPNKVFDYMSCAKPILLGIDGVARKLVEESRSGYYVDPENPIEFKKKILELYQNQQLQKQLGENGLAYVQENFSRENLAKKYANEIKKVAKK
nr:glycosyltransferase family 4 protein [Lederbergia citrea]